MLADAGSCRVRIMGRPGAHTDAIRQHGIRVFGLKELSVPLEFADEANPVGECDVIIYATKAQHTAAALEQTTKINVREFVASIQNGVIKDDELVDAFGREKVVGAVAMVAGARTEPGTINFTYDGGTFLGELDGGASERVEGFVALCEESGLVATAVDDIVAASWTKMVGWIPVGLLASLTRCDNATILSNELLAAAFVGVVRELNELAVAKGVKLMDIGPYSSRSWCQGEIDEAVKDVMSSPLTSNQSTHSALQDVNKGLTTEFEACVRPMIEEASRLGIQLSGTRLLYATLMGLEISLQAGRGI